MTKSLFYSGDKLAASLLLFSSGCNLRTRNTEIHRLMFLVFVRWQNLIPRPGLDWWCFRRKGQRLHL